MLKKKYMILIASVMFGLAAIAGGCGAKEADDTTVENQTVEDDAETTGEDASQGTGLTFTTKDIYGETVTEAVFQDYDLTLVNIFATWCSPCIAEMPELAQLDKNMEEKNVNVIAICIDALDNRGELDQNAVALAQQIAELSEAKFRFLVPDETYLNGRLINVQAVPESFFVDKNGNVVGETYVGARDLETWTQVVEQELSNLYSGK